MVHASILNPSNVVCLLNAQYPMVFSTFFHLKLHHHPTKKKNEEDRSNIDKHSRILPFFILQFSFCCIECIAEIGKNVLFRPLDHFDSSSAFQLTIWPSFWLFGPLYFGLLHLDLWSSGLHFTLLFFPSYCFFIQLQILRIMIIIITMNALNCICPPNVSFGANQMEYNETEFTREQQKKTELTRFQTEIILFPSSQFFLNKTKKNGKYFNIGPARAPGPGQPNVD